MTTYLFRRYIMECIGVTKENIENEQMNDKRLLQLLSR